MKHEKFLELDRDNRIYWGPKGENMPALKRFLSEVKQGIVPQTLWTYEEVGHTQDAKKELLEFVKSENTDNVLDSVKPIRLIQRMLQVGGDPAAQDIVVDFFAGSGPTGHAVMEQNREDGGNRRFVLVQLPEPLPIPEKQRVTIADITKERVRRVVKKLNDEDEAAEKVPKQLTLTPGPLLEGEVKQPQDRGFRVFKLGESNFKPWNAEAPKDSKELAKQLELHIDHIRDGRTTDDLLYEILLKSGFPLTTPVEKLTVPAPAAAKGKKAVPAKIVYSVAGGALHICLERALTLELIRVMAELKPERVVCLDAGFTGNDQLKANAVQIFKPRASRASRRYDRGTSPHFNALRRRGSSRPSHRCLTAGRSRRISWQTGALYPPTASAAQGIA